MLFSERLKIHKDFIKWTKEYSVNPDSFTVITCLDVTRRLIRVDLGKEVEIKYA